MALPIFLDWNWPAADSAFQRALARSPSYAVAHKWYSDVLHVYGRDAEAEREALRARELDPLSAANLSNVAGLALRRGDTSAFLRVIEQALALDPTQPHALRQMTSLAFDRGDSARFFAAQKNFVGSSVLAGLPAEDLRRAWQRGGRDAVVRAQIAAFDSLELPFEAARWRMKGGDLDGMFRDLDHAFEAHAIWLPVVKWYITSPAATHDPRFKALLARLNIAEDNP